MPKTPSQQFLQQNAEGARKINNKSETFTNSVAAVGDKCYFVDSVEGCHLLVMLVDQLIRSLDVSLGSLGSGHTAAYSPSTSSEMSSQANRQICSVGMATQKLVSHKPSKHSFRLDFLFFYILQNVLNIYKVANYNKIVTVFDVYNH